MRERYFRFFGPRYVDDLDEELAFHRDMRVRDYLATGMTQDEARRLADLRLGDLTPARDACVAIASRRQRRVSRTQIVDALKQDVRFAARTLGRNRGWTAIAVLTLALGIGANSAVFSVVNHLLLNPLPYPDAGRVVIVYQEPFQGNSTGMTIMITPKGRIVSAWEKGARSIEAIEPYSTTDVTVRRDGQTPVAERGAFVRPSFFAFTGQRPLIGRIFSETETSERADVALLSEGSWRLKYGADRGVLGRTISVDGKLLTIIGVMPASLQVPRAGDTRVDLWRPLDMRRSDDVGVQTVARLRKGVSRDVASRELNGIAQRIEMSGTSKVRYTTVLKGPAEMVNFRESLVLLGGAVALVLLIACANVAHLLLARATTREREMAVRAALGAGRERIFRQLLTESMMLSIAGCVVGLALGYAMLTLLVGVRPESLADLTGVRMDRTTLAATAAASIVCGLLFGMIGASAGAKPVSARRSHGRMRALLVVTEMAMCTVLLVGASLLLRSVMHLRMIDPGFNAKGLYALRTQLPESYRTAASKSEFYRQLVERARVVPGVEVVVLAGAAPPATNVLIGALQIEGQPEPPAGTTSFINFNSVMPGYFRMMGIRLLEGSTFTDTTANSTQILINEGMAKKHWAGQSPVGKRLRVVYNGFGDWKTIVGVVANAATRGLTSDASEPMLYSPSSDLFSPSLIVRSARDASVMQELGAIVMRIDPALAPPEMTSIADAMDKTIARPRFTMFLLVVFTGVAVGLAAIGLYGVLAYTVAQRTRDIGIRIALGATRARVARSVMVQGLVLAIIGTVLGLVGARAGVRWIGSMLYGVEQTDVVAFAASAALLLVIALLACFVPMRRAVGVDPMVAIRAD
jgi:predicted permease